MFLNRNSLNNTNLKIAVYYKKGVYKWYNIYKRFFYNRKKVNKKVLIKSFSQNKSFDNYKNWNYVIA